MWENTRDVLDHIANNSRFVVRRDNYERIAEYLAKLSRRDRAQSARQVRLPDSRELTR